MCSVSVCFTMWDGDQAEFLALHVNAQIVKRFRSLLLYMAHPGPPDLNNNACSWVIQLGTGWDWEEDPGTGSQNV